MSAVCQETTANAHEAKSTAENNIENVNIAKKLIKELMETSVQIEKYIK